MLETTHAAVGAVAQELANRLRRAIVDNNQLDVAVRLVETGLDRLPQELRAVIGGQDNADLGGCIPSSPPVEAAACLGSGLRGGTAVDADPTGIGLVDGP